MVGQFEKLMINQELTSEEIMAIDALKDVKSEDLKAALKTEKLAGTNESFLDMTTAFSTFNVNYKEGEFDNYGNPEAGLTCNDNAPNRLKDMIADKDNNDFAYFLYKVSGFLNVAAVTGLETKKIGKATKDQLTGLKTEIEKAPAPIIPPEDNKNKPVDDKKNTPKDNEDKLTPETLKPEEITFKLYSGVTQGEVLIAVEKLRKANPALANTIIPLLKSGDIVGAQKALGMKEDATKLYEKADGLFGSRTLKNLEAGKVIEQKSTYVPKGPKEKKESKNMLKDYTITMYEKPYTFELNESTRTDLDYLKTTYGSFEKVFWDMKDRFDADAEGNLSDFPLKYDFVQRIKPLFANDKWQDEKDTDGNAYAKIEDYINGMKLNTLVEKIGGKAKPAESNDKYGKIIQIKTIDDRNNFPASHTRKEKKVYVLSLTDKTYVFYGNGRVKISDANNQKKFEMKNTDDIIDNLIKSEEMDVETQNESINRIGKKIFGYYEKQINKSISDIPGIQLQTSISDNPYLFIAESDTWNVIRKINVNNYVKDGVLDMATLKKHIEFTKKRTDNLKKTIETLRGRSYSAEEIFGKNNKLIKPDAYRTFFSYFEDNNNRVMIDKNKSYTFYQPTSGSDVHYATIQFDLDESGPFDHKYCKGLTIDTMNDKAINKDGTLNETELKKFLAEKITAIINNPENGYI